MTQQRRYFDNAATSHPKPPGVAAAVLDYFETVHASAGRGAYREAVESERLLNACRDEIRRLFNARPEDHVVFTLNGTDALNLAIKGVVRPGGHVLTTVMDHNSVLRPLTALAECGIVTWTVAEVDPETTRLDPARLAEAIRPGTQLVAINHASNVTGVLQPIADIAEVCSLRGVTLLVDAAQSAGHVPIDFRALPVDLLALPGHKGLLGPLGTGILLIRAGVEERVRPLREGGTGSHSESARQPDEPPDRFESGSHNAVGIAGLLAAVRWIHARGVAALREHEARLCAYMMQRLDAMPGVRWFGPRDVTQRVGVFSVRIEGIEPAELSASLEQHAGILTRSGLHCAPLAHRTIGTLGLGGTTRLSFGPFLERADMEAACDALFEIAAAVRPAEGAGRVRSG